MQNMETLANINNIVYLFKQQIYSLSEALNRLAMLGVPVDDAASMLEM
jgi:hypothetical protein